ncbi:MAG TPA: S8 family peptidase [Longimicrobiaceae bacterium]|nr:S8 family peptidase [Longimicrobiaceae bacterium]
MKPIRLLGAAALSLGLLAPLSAQVTPAPPPAAPDATATVTRLPDNWWLLDPTADHVAGISAERAYRELLAGLRPKRTVVVAIIDSGVDVEHADLNDNVWTNEDEVPGNGRDDDNNGYVDDVHGWDFIGGANGRDVHYDTYESTRLYAQYSRRFANANPETLPAAERAEYQRYLEIKAKFEEDRAEAQAMVQQLRMIDTEVQRRMGILRAHFAPDPVTPERVHAIPATARPDVLEAKELFLQMEAAGFTAEQVTKERKDLEARLEYGLNPAFDPRATVGDDYANPNERVYGNAEVEGPDADHGTHVAGIVAAERNDTGVNGVASSVRVMVIRTVPNGDERDKDVANAIRYAADNGANVINMSFGKAFSPQKEVVDEAVRYAEAKGVLLVHAAGNAASDIGEEPSYPTREFVAGGQARNWIEVGASAPALDSLAASFSNFSRERVDVFAPGVNILSTMPNGRYEQSQGTSMAAPVVSGVAALLMAYFPELSAAEVKAVILESATRFAGQNVIRPGAENGETVPFAQLSATGGVVNVYAAVQLAQQRVRGR